jgi:hypothetical protein
MSAADSTRIVLCRLSAQHVEMSSPQSGALAVQRYPPSTAPDPREDELFARILNTPVAVATTALSTRRSESAKTIDAVRRTMRGELVSRSPTRTGLRKLTFSCTVAMFCVPDSWRAVEPRARSAKAMIRPPCTAPRRLRCCSPHRSPYSRPPFSVWRRSSGPIIPMNPSSCISAHAASVTTNPYPVPASVSPAQRLLLPSGPADCNGRNARSAFGGGWRGHQRRGLEAPHRRRPRRLRRLDPRDHHESAAAQPVSGVTA